MVKQSVMRGVWSVVEACLHEHFEKELHEQFEFVHEAMEREWADDIPGLMRTNAYMAQSELTDWWWPLAVKIGKCRALIEIMCHRDGDLNEQYLIQIEEELA